MINKLKSLFTVKRISSDLERFIKECNPESNEQVEFLLKKYDERKALIAKAMSEHDYSRAVWISKYF